MFKKYIKKYDSLKILWAVLILTSTLFCVQKFGLKTIKIVNADEQIALSKENQSDHFAYELYAYQRKNFFFKANENKDDSFKKEIDLLVKDYPIEEMSLYIAKYNRKVAGLIIGIAKKESNWGRRSPSKNGKTCYNYWGYKGVGSRGFSMGYGCFSTPEEAVNVIGGRIQELVNKGLATPSKMIVWKCGNSCETHSKYSVEKWISDVSLYYNKVKKLKS